MLNKSKFINQIEKKTGWVISPMTFWYWNKKYNFIIPFYQGENTTLFKEEQIEDAIEKLKVLHNSGKITIRRKKYII